MSERSRKVESVIHQIVAAELPRLPDAARLTITGVQVSPDLRNATIWVGVLADDDATAQQLFGAATAYRGALQEVVARKMTTKFVPRIHLERDSGGQYAQAITKLIRGL